MKQFVKILTVFLVLFISLKIIGTSFAARNLNINIDKSSIYGDEDLTVTASQSGFTNGEIIYIKGAFYQDGCGSSCNYFGYTKNGDSWIQNGDTTTTQQQIKIGDWDGKIIAKSDFLDSGYKGEGDYLFKVGFYYITSGGNLSSVNWSSNSATLVINEPKNTPTYTSSLTSTSTPTSTKTPTPTNTTVPTFIPVTVSMASETADILGESTDDANLNFDISETPQVSEVPMKNNSVKVLGIEASNLSKVMIGTGLILMISCGILTFLKWKKYL